MSNIDFASVKIFVSQAPASNALSVSVSPANAVISPGQSATFTATASGGSGNYVYAWFYGGPLYARQEFLGYSCQRVPRSAACSTSALSVNQTVSVSPTQNSIISVVVYDEATETIDERFVQVTVNPSLLSVSISPTNAVISPGQSATFTATASGGSGQYIYTWEAWKSLADDETNKANNCYDTRPLPSACDGIVIGTQSSVTFVPNSVNIGLGYLVFVYDSATGKTIFKQASIIYSTPSNVLSVSVSPANAVISPGQSATFTATASGGSGNYVYAWFYGSPFDAFLQFETNNCQQVPIPVSCTSNSLSINPIVSVAPTQNSVVSVIVYDTATGHVAHEAAQVTINPQSFSNYYALNIYYEAISTNSLNRTIEVLTPETGLYAPGSIATISAPMCLQKDCEGYVFSGWKGSGMGNYTGKENASTITMNSNIIEIADYVSHPGTIATSSTTISTTTTVGPNLPSYTVYFKKGWNLFSVPLKYASSIDYSASTCVRSDFTSPLLEYSNGQYSDADTIYGYVGYWVDSGVACSIKFYGPELSGNRTIGIGWNIIGTPESKSGAEGMHISDFSGNCYVLGNPLSYDTNTSTYYNSTTVYPGKGYFIYVMSGCEIGSPENLQAPPPPPSPP
jgi:hypothetical protein